MQLLSVIRCAARSIFASAITSNKALGRRMIPRVRSTVAERRLSRTRRCNIALASPRRHGRETLRSDEDFAATWLPRSIRTSQRIVGRAGRRYPHAAWRRRSSHPVGPAFAGLDRMQARRHSPSSGPLLECSHGEHPYGLTARGLFRASPFRGGVGAGFEPATPRFLVWCSSPLS
jgi:hypothetical protein